MYQATQKKKNRFLVTREWVYAHKKPAYQKIWVYIQQKDDRNL